MVAFNDTRLDDRPPDHILAWCRNHLAVIQDGGVWGIPRSGTIFKVDHKNKRLILMTAGNDAGDDFRATRHVFRYIGWTVIRQNEENRHNEQ